MRDVLSASIRRHSRELDDLAKKIHACPELGMEERRAVAWQTELLRRWGFRVQAPFAGLPTAYKAVRGTGAPVFCFMAEYDALPDLGHACGHNLICTVALGAGKALADALKAERRPGTVIVMGTPGEEGLGGKVLIARRGGLKGLDAVMMAHPVAHTGPDTSGLAIMRRDVVFHGRAVHAAASPEDGLNALDAVMLLFHAVNAWRQHLPETCRMHGIVTEGGVKPNIVPERAACSFYLRAEDDRTLAKMEKRFRSIARGAALMTGTRETMMENELPYRARRPNQPLNEAYVAEAKALGMRPRTPKRPGRGSSDFGDVSQLVPGAHVYFGIARGELPGHSVAFTRAAGTPYARAQMLRAAEALARVGWRYCTEPAFRQAVSADLRRRKSGTALCS